MERNKISRRDFLKLSALGLGTMAFGKFFPKVDPVEKVLAAGNESRRVDPIRRPDEISEALELDSLDEVREFLEGGEGSKWLSGDYKQEISEFPWNSEEAWKMFGDLKTVGDREHYVVLMPHPSDKNKFSMVGLETVNGQYLIDYIDADGNPKIVVSKTPFTLKDVVGLENYDDTIYNSCVVWPDIPTNIGNPTTRFFSKTGGETTNGWVQSSDGTRYHAFASQNAVPEEYK